MTASSTQSENRAEPYVTSNCLKTAKTGLPGNTYQNAPGEPWRSWYDQHKNVVVINNGHRNFLYASRTKVLKLRYICRLFAKEIIFHDFPGHQSDAMLERMVELLLYVEEHLR